MGLTLQKGPWTACSEYWRERRGRWLLSGTFSAALCPTPASIGINGVLSQSHRCSCGSSHRCSFLVILPQCQSLLAWQHPLHLSAVLWAEHNQNSCVMGSFLWVNFLGTWMMWYVCLFVKYEKGFLQDIELTFQNISQFFYVNRKLMFDFFFPLLPISIINMS